MSNNEGIGKGIASSKTSAFDRLKEIDALYNSQIKKIENETKTNGNGNTKVKKAEFHLNGRNHQPKQEFEEDILKDDDSEVKDFQDVDSRSSRVINDKPNDSKIRASIYLQGESTRTIEILRKENENKEMKIRELSNKCESLIEKLKKHLTAGELEGELESLKQHSDRTMERLENLFKIKHEEMFFKIKLQIIGLLQEFEFGSEEINGINEVNNESELYSFMVRKLKLKLKSFRSKEQESTMEIQKDKILSQKHEERIHFLIETNELMKLTESKLKTKVEDLRSQLNSFMERVKSRDKDIEDRESEIFRLKKQYDELLSANQKQIQQNKALVNERAEERKVFEAKEKEMKNLLSNYFMERKKQEEDIEEKEGEIEELTMKLKFGEQEIERLNREYIRWKERYEWIEKEKENKHKEFEEEKAQLINEFMEYKNDNNQAVYLGCKAETDEVLRKLEEYQNAYQKIVHKLEEEKEQRLQKEEEMKEVIENNEKEWLEKIKRIEKLKEQEMIDASAEHQVRLTELVEQFEKKQELLEEELQARMKAEIAENDKMSTQSLIEMENENDDLRKEIENLYKMIDVKNAMIGELTIQGKSQS